MTNSRTQLANFAHEAGRLRDARDRCPWWRPMRRRKLDRAYRGACQHADRIRETLQPGPAAAPGLDEMLSEQLGAR
jgi:hypothetical protein